MDESPATIRRCRPEDVAAVVALSKRWAAEGSTIGQLACSAEMARGWLDPSLVLAEVGGEAVGFAYGVIETSEGLAVIPIGESYLRLEELYVVPEHRDQGIGGRLVDVLLAQAAKEGVTRGRVYSSSRDWRRIIDFYGRHGFRMWYVELVR